MLVVARVFVACFSSQTANVLRDMRSCKFCPSPKIVVLCQVLTGFVTLVYHVFGLMITGKITY